VSTDKRPIIIKKVKKVEGEGHHGGQWKIAYADFMTAMMAFFLVMWLINMTSEEKRAKIAMYFRTFSIFESLVALYWKVAQVSLLNRIQRGNLK